MPGNRTRVRALSAATWFFSPLILLELNFNCWDECDIASLHDGIDGVACYFSKGHKLIVVQSHLNQHLLGFGVTLH